MSRCGADGTQHSWCTSVHSELKSIGPISIGAEYISFVLRFSRLKWSCICDDISFFFHRRERPSVLRDSVSMQNHVNWFFFFCLFTCIVAEALPLFSPPVQPGTEAHEDNPAGPSQTGDEGRLLHHVRDAIVALRSRHYVPQLCTWGHACTRGRGRWTSEWLHVNSTASEWTNDYIREVVVNENHLEFKKKSIPSPLRYKTRLKCDQNKQREKKNPKMNTNVTKEDNVNKNKLTKTNQKTITRVLVRLGVHVFWDCSAKARLREKRDN